MANNKMITWLRSFLPSLVQINHLERLRSSMGALIGLMVTAGFSSILFGPVSNIPLLVAPIGASAVLLFAVPASPLAQPWSLIGGNLIAATIGVTCAHFIISNSILAAAVALALSIIAMFFFRCIHPPSGAVALTAVLGGPTIHALGYQFVLAPIGINSLVLLGIAIFYHRLTGHSYPHSPHASTFTPTPKTSFTPKMTPDSNEISALKADLQAVLKKRNEMLDIDIDDLEAVLKEVETHTYQRHMRGLDCGSVMSTNVKSVTPDMTAAAAWNVLHQHKIKAVPVIDEQQHVIGIVTQMDFVQRTIVHEFTDLAKFQSLDTHVTASGTAGNTLLVKDIMSTPVKTAFVTQPLADLVPLFSYYGHHHLPVVDTEQKLVGIVTQANIVQGLYQKTLDKTRIMRS